MQATEGMRSDVLDLDRKREIGDQKGGERPLNLSKAIGQLPNNRDVRCLVVDPLPKDLWLKIAYHFSVADLTTLSQVSCFFRSVKNQEMKRRCSQDYAKVTSWVLENLPGWRKEEGLSDSRTPNWNAVYRVSHALRTKTTGDLITKTPAIYLAVLANGHLISTGAGLISVIDPITGKQVSLSQIRGGGFGLRPLILSDGNTIAGLDESHRAITLYCRDQVVGYYPHALLQNQAKMQWRCFGALAPNRLIAVCDRSIHIWDINPVSKTQEITKLPWKRGSTPTAIATWNSRYAAVALDVLASKEGRPSQSRQVIVLDLETGKECYRFEDEKGLHGTVESLAFLKGYLLALGHFDGTITVLDLKNQKVIGTKKRHREGVISLAVLPNGTLVSGGWDGGGLVCVHRQLRLREAALTPDSDVLLQSASTQSE